MDNTDFKTWLESAAEALGAHSVACVRMDSPALREAVAEHAARYGAWLKAGLHGEMDYLERMAAEKADPWQTFPAAKSVLVVTFRDGWGEPAAVHPFPAPAEGALVGYISAYATGADYHHSGQILLGGLAAELEKKLGCAVDATCAVDTKPVYERLFAQVGGLGERGVNDLLRVPGRVNTRVFIGCLFVDVELPEVIQDPALPFGCADCRACEKRCPTGAITFGKPFDARTCISYLTIEKRGVLSQAEAAMMGDWLFGCDWCTVSCPPRDKVETRIPVDLEWLLKSSAGSLRKVLKGNAASYAGVTQLRKNAVVMLKGMKTPAANRLLDWVRENSGSDLIQRQIDLW